MVKLAEGDIRTREVLDWRGIHVLHNRISSCSAKLRIFLNIKQVPWQSHEIDLTRNENMGEWFLGINPRGLVPTLVHDGDVHIESNDILLYLEERFPLPRLIPEASAGTIAALLRHEDELHLDLRTLSFRYVFAPPVNPKPPEVLKQFAASGSGTVNGVEDESKAEQIAYWEKYADQGIPDRAVRESAQRFAKALAQLDDRLATDAYLLGDTLSLLDIAWFIYVNRLMVAGYPVAQRHPRLAAWYEGLLARPEFASEVGLPPPLQAHVADVRRRDVARSQTLEEVAAL